MGQVVSFVNNPVRWDQSTKPDSFTVYGLERLRGVYQGIGLLYFYCQEFFSGRNPKIQFKQEFVLMKSKQIGYGGQVPDAVTTSLDASVRFPCSGIITGTGEGYIIAPTIRFDIAEGRDLALMLLSPMAKEYGLSLEKVTLEASGETIVLSTVEDEVRCSGTLVGGGFKWARLILNRNPSLPVFTKGFNEQLSEIKEPGVISTAWKPIRRNFEECLVALRPSALLSSDAADGLIVNEIAAHLGAPEDDYSGMVPDYVVGDGVGVQYSLRLVIDHGLGRHSSDEARLILS